MTSPITPYVRERFGAFAQLVQHFATISLPDWHTEVAVIQRFSGALSIRGQYAENALATVEGATGCLSPDRIAHPAWLSAYLRTLQMIFWAYVPLLAWHASRLDSLHAQRYHPQTNVCGIWCVAPSDCCM